MQLSLVLVFVLTVVAPAAPLPTDDDSTDMDELFAMSPTPPRRRVEVRRTMRVVYDSSSSDDEPARLRRRIVHGFFANERLSGREASSGPVSIPRPRRDVTPPLNEWVNRRVPSPPTPMSANSTSPSLLSCAVSPPCSHSYPGPSTSGVPRPPAPPGLSTSAMPRPQASAQPGPSTGAVPRPPTPPRPSADAVPRPALPLPAALILNDAGYQNRTAAQGARDRAALLHQYLTTSTVSRPSWTAQTRIRYLLALAQIVRQLLDLFPTIAERLSGGSELEVLYEVPQLWYFMLDSVHRVLAEAVSSPPPYRPPSPSQNTTAGPDEPRCVICLDSRAVIAILYCGHLFCAGCLLRIDMCALCKGPVMGRLRLFRP